MSLSERWQAFSTAAGPRRYVLGAIITVVIALIDWFKSLLEKSGAPLVPGLSSWAVAAIFAVGLVAYWLLERVVQLERSMRGARAELARLRTSGVVIRNDGRTTFHNPADFAAWEQKALKWNDDVIANIKEDQ